MGFKFAGTSPGNSVENYSAAVTDEYIDGPLHRDGPSYASVVAGTSFCYFQTRAHTTEPTMGRHNCERPSSGNLRVINESYLTRPGWGFFKKSQHIKNPTLHFTPFLPSSSYFPPFSTSKIISAKILTVIIC